MKNRYSRLDRFLHNLALGNKAVRALSFDINQTFLDLEADTHRNEPHVFVAGLARSGTSILLDVLFRSGNFSTLTYRHMPFVLAPNLWFKVNRSHRRTAGQVERAHGDGIKVDFDSPEAFEEVFWLTFCETYVRDQGIEVQAEDAISQDTLNKFVVFVQSVVSSSGSNGASNRYLSKNNNNVIRLTSLRRAFPHAHIVIPFRNPSDHALSLCRQHDRFSQMQSDDTYVRDYMNWLGHHEFGLDQKPFLVAGIEETLEYNRATPNYWLSYWINIHRHLMVSAPPGSIFVNHDRLCACPEIYLDRLADRLSLRRESLDHSMLKARRSQFRTDFDPVMLAVAEELFENLMCLDSTV